MPVYIVHGFRWPRDGFTGIRVHAIIHNLEDCSAEYIQNENSRSEILSSFRKSFPDIMKELEGPGQRIDFLEQYDPEDETSTQAVSQPYAFVGDRVFMFACGPNAPSKQPHMLQEAVGTALLTTPRTRSHTPAMSKAAPFNAPASPTDLSVNVGEVIADGPGLTTRAWEALADLRDKIAEGEKIGWWVVYNGDPERAYDDIEDNEEEQSEDGEHEEDGIHEHRQKQLPNLPNATGRQGGYSNHQTSPLSTVQNAQATRNTASDSSSKGPAVASTTSQQTRLPIRDKDTKASASDASPEVEMTKEKVVASDPSKLSDVAKSQGLRRKIFGKRAG